MSRAGVWIEDWMCYLPDWMTGWYWRRELGRVTRRAMKRWEDPVYRETVMNLPPAGAICRECGNLWMYANGRDYGPCEHQGVRRGDA